MVLDRRAFLWTGAVAVGGFALDGQARAQAPASSSVPLAQGGDVSAQKLIAAARQQIGVTTRYDPAYVRLAFPGGDVPRERGVCTDVIVRAYRDAMGIDLQALVNADMRRAFAAYPTRWGLGSPDPNIDHRRVPNLEVFFERKGVKRRTPTRVTDWQPGDIVTQRLNAPGALRQGPPHIGILSDARDKTSGRLLVIHNIGLGTREDDILEQYQIVGRFGLLSKS